MPLSKVIHGFLTVDLEDWYHANYDGVEMGAWDRMESHVAGHTAILLEMFARHGHKATFFTLGAVAEKHPELLCAIRDAGHEIACHGYGHAKVWDLGAEGFRQDLRRAKAAIEAACGVTPRGFRAPSWSISPPRWKNEGDNFWPLRVLQEEGFRYDSSLFPFKTFLYGVAGAPTAPHRIALGENAEIIELPAAVTRLGGRLIPFAGGFYFRLYPLALTRFLCHRFLRSSSQPFMFYIHPREVSPVQPRLPLKGKERFIQYYGLKRGQRKLDAFLEKFTFSPISNYLDSQNGFVLL